MKEFFMINAVLCVLALLAALAWGVQGISAMLRNRGRHVVRENRR